VVLTGGAAMMPGVAELAEEVFEIPTRIGLPHDITGVRDVAKNPTYATAVGLLIYGRHQLHPRVAVRAGGSGGTKNTL
jgi:cell division protein FtsA